MPLSIKQSGAWKECQSLHVKVDGEWKEISELFSKKDGAWVTVFSSGALIEFTSYPHPIPVMAGWQYKKSTDSSWTNVTSNGKINTSGTFTGYVKAKGELSLSNYYNGSERYVSTPGRITTATTMSSVRFGFGIFINGSKAYVCGGYAYNPVDVVDIYTSSGTKTTGTTLSYKRHEPATFCNAGYGYVCGGYYGSSSSQNTSSVDVYDSSGNLTTGNALSRARSYAASFVLNNKGYVCCGTNNWSGKYGDVDIYDSAGNHTTGSTLSYTGEIRHASSMGDYGFLWLPSYAYACDKSGNWTSIYGTHSHRNAEALLEFGDKTILAGGYSGSSGTDSGLTGVSIIDSSKMTTAGTSLSKARWMPIGTVVDSLGFVCGGLSGNSATAASTGRYTDMEIYEKTGVRTLGSNTLSIPQWEGGGFTLGSYGFICGGHEFSDNAIRVSALVSRIYNSFSTRYFANIPITEGSEYTLNGTTATATESTTLSFDSKVSGTINYKKGVIPS